jgi:hypothetical protein
MATFPEVVIRHIIAVLNWPSKVEEKLTKGKTVVNKLTGNANFPVSSWPANVISLAQLTTDVNALDTAETGVKSKTVTTASRNAAANTVHSDLRKILTMVQTAADANPANAENLIKGAGFDVKVVTIKQKQQNSVQNTEISGTILATADGTGPHSWQISSDKAAITTLEATKQAHTLIPNLTPGQVYYVRNKKIPNKKEKFDWSEWKEVRVQ